MLQCEWESNILCVLHITKCTDKDNIFLFIKFEISGEDICNDGIPENNNKLSSCSSDI